MSNNTQIDAKFIKFYHIHDMHKETLYTLNTETGTVTWDAQPGDILEDGEREATYQKHQWTRFLGLDAMKSDPCWIVVE